MDAREVEMQWMVEGKLPYCPNDSNLFDDHGFFPLFKLVKIQSCLVRFGLAHPF